MGLRQLFYLGMFALLCLSSAPSLHAQEVGVGLHNMQTNQAVSTLRGKVNMNEIALEAQERLMQTIRFCAGWGLAMPDGAPIAPAGTSFDRTTNPNLKNLGGNIALSPNSDVATYCDFPTATTEFISQSCAAGEILKADAGGDMVCAPDGLDEMPCGPNMILKTDGAGNLTCQQDSIDVTVCGVNQLVKYNGTQWVCTDPPEPQCSCVNKLGTVIETVCGSPFLDIHYANGEPGGDCHRVSICLPSGWRHSQGIGSNCLSPNWELP